MKIIILGAGEVGFNVAKQLINEGRNVVLIEKNLDKVKSANNRLDCMVIYGDGTDLNVLKDISIEKVDIFLALTDSDEVNLISSLIIDSEFNVSKVITRIKKIAYEKTKLLKKKIGGIDYVVNPELEAANNILNVIEEGAISDVFLFNRDVQMRCLYIKSESMLKGKSLRELKEYYSGNYIVAGIQRGDNIIIPSGKTKIIEGDMLYIIGERRDLDPLFIKGGVSFKRLKNVVIVGGTTIGEIVISKLLNLDINVKLIDKDYEICKIFSEKYSKLTVINDNITSEGIFEEENLKVFDLIITTTENEELNILSAIYGKTVGIKRAIALVDKQNYISMSNQLGLDATVSPKSSSVNAILKYIRRGHIKSIYTIFNGKAEAIEYTISKDSVLVGKSLKRLDLPSSSLIISINRGNNNYIPDGNFVLKEGDNIVIFAKREAINRIEDLIS
ncbi:MAG: Trk system potassium transporter TrkA [Deferribacterota bacterium]|nr:Trk system potassium transporter TrkA [Deferribacterota bacterium]